MTGATKLALVPLVVLWLWALPRDQPNTEVAGALVATVEADAAIAEFGPETTTTINLASPTTTEPASTVSTVASVAAIVADSTTSTTFTTTTVATANEAPAVTAAPASAVESTTTPPAAPEALATVPIGQLALDRMSFDWTVMFPVWRVEFLGPRDGLRALTYPSEKRIEIFVRSDDTAETLHRVFAHELGHVIDVELNNDTDRSRWAQQRNLPADAPWWPNAAAPDFATGAGDFAEAFAVMETGVVTRSSIGRQPNAEDLGLLQELMRG